MTHATVEETQRRMSSKEFTQWAAFLQVGLNGGNARKQSPEDMWKYLTKYYGEHDNTSDGSAG